MAVQRLENKNKFLHRYKIKQVFVPNHEVKVSKLLMC